MMIKKYICCSIVLLSLTLHAMNMQTKKSIIDVWQTTKLPSELLSIICHYLRTYEMGTAKECKEIHSFNNPAMQHEKQDDYLPDIPYVAVLDDDHFVSGHRDGALRVWDIAQQVPVAIHADPETDPVDALAGLDATSFVVGTQSGSLRSWSYTPHMKHAIKCHKRHISKDAVTKIVSLESGDFLSLHQRSMRNVLRLWNKNKTRQTQKFHPKAYVQDIAAQKDGYFLTAQDATPATTAICKWTKDLDYIQSCIVILPKIIHCLASLDDTDYVAASNKGTIELGNKHQTQKFTVNFPNATFSVIATLNKKQLAVCFEALHLWDIKDNQNEMEQSYTKIAAHPKTIISSVAVFPNGLLLTAAGDSIKLWGTIKKSEFERVFQPFVTPCLSARHSQPSSYAKASEDAVAFRRSLS